MRALKIEKRITSRETDGIQKYLNELNVNCKTITRSEEIELFKSYKNGDESAKEKIIKSNLRFVVSVAKQYQGSSNLPLEDLINEGNIGLIKSIDKFDIDKDIKFISYAVWWIRQSILKCITDNGNFMRLPDNKVTQIKRIRDAKDALMSQINREPSIEEIVDYIVKKHGSKNKMEEEEIEELLALHPGATSLDSRVNDSEEGTLMDLIPNENSEKADSAFENSHNEYMVRVAMKFLSDKEKAVVEMLYGLNGHTIMSPDDIAESFAITRQRVMQIKDTSLRLMKRGLSKNVLNNKYMYA